MSLHKTRIDIPTKTRDKVTKLLGERLIDMLDLKLAVKQAHWNVKGPDFIQLHELFDEIAGRIEGHADALAERITSLGGVALGRVQVVAKGTSLAPYPDNIFTGPKHLAALAERLAAVAKATRLAIDTTDDWDDEVTSDLFTQITGVLDKDLWFIEAHLQA
jgi:starvation-inducible DNA-binding protein